MAATVPGQMCGRLSGSPACCGARKVPPSYLPLLPFCFPSPTPFSRCKCK
jgi:hypothetical protein